MDARSPSLMDRSATSHPRIMDPSPTTTRCRSDRANGGEAAAAEAVLQKYFTMTVSPARMDRPDPSTVVVLEMPLGEADVDVVGSSPAAAVEYREVDNVNVAIPT